MTCVLIGLADLGRAEDWRNIRNGHEIPDENYCDQPYVVVTDDGNWLCTLTTGEGREGHLGQHVVSTISTDKGKTWSKLTDIEPADGPEASWVTPLKVPSGRVYAFYNYNGDNVHSFPNSDRHLRADMLGWWCYRYSDDNGRTWSDKRYRIPMRVTACDRANQWNGKVQIFWGIDEPSIAGGAAYFAFTKLGRYMLDNGEGWLFRSEDILTESDPEEIDFTLLPEGEHGLRNPKFGSVQEEHNLVWLGGERFYCVYRTTTGYPAHCYSDDGGRSWTKPVHMTYAPGRRRIKNPRACPMLWRTKQGKYLFWFHNHSGKTFRDRNPVWISGGEVKDGKLHWSEPEILLYDPDPDVRISYPDLIEQDGQFWVSETQKSVARVHKLDRSLLEGLWRQGDVKKVTRDGLELSVEPGDAEGQQIRMPGLPDLTEGGGFSVGMWLRFDDLEAGQILLDSRNAKGQGVWITTTEDSRLKLHFSDGERTAAWDCDPGLLETGKWHHVVFTVDGGPRIVTVLVDGRLCDGGEHRQYGWGRFDPKMGSVTGAKKVKIGPSFQGTCGSVRIYDRALRTSEAVSNFHAGR